MLCQLSHDRRAGEATRWKREVGSSPGAEHPGEGTLMSASPGQGCTWLKTLGPLCVPEPEVNLSEVTDGRKVPSTWEHTPQAVSEQVRVPWSEACLRKLRGSLQAAPPHLATPLPAGHRHGVHASWAVTECPSSWCPLFSFRSQFFFHKKSPCSSFSLST